MDIENTANPYRFYQLSGGNCTIGLNLVRTRSEEFHGMSFWGNQKNVSVTGTLGYSGGYILFDGIQLGPSRGENLYLDQQNEVVFCAANCFLKEANNHKLHGGEVNAAIVVGPDATTTAQGLTPIIAQLDQGIMHKPYVNKDGSEILFVTPEPPPGKACNCRVALGSGMLDVLAKGGVPTTNDPTRLTGQTTYAPPTFANAATVGAPSTALTLDANELGIATSPPGTPSAPGKSGLKLRVECSSSGSHNVTVVALAGTSTNETVIADGIGGGTISTCH